MKEILHMTVQFNQIFINCRGRVIEMLTDSIIIKYQLLRQSYNIRFKNGNNITDHCMK